MALSIHTNFSGMLTTNALNKTNAALGANQQAAGTGYRINSAADDAAGLQMATRLKAQSNGMETAMRNIDNSISFLQTAEGAFSEMTDIVQRMKNLATNAANATITADDRVAIQAEYDEMGKELSNIIKNTKFAGEGLFSDGTDVTGAAGKFGAAAVVFQIGSSGAETLSLDVQTELKAIGTALSAVSQSYKDGTAGSEIVAADGTAATTQIDALADALDDITALRSKFGATINRLGHTNNNLANMNDNTKAAYGSLMDTDFAKVSADMSKNTMLMQSGISMLKQSNQMSGLAMSLLG